MTAKSLSPRSPRVEVTEVTEVTVRGVEGLFEKVVTKFGTGAKIDCPKKYLGKTVYVVIRRDPPGEEFARTTREPASLGNVRSPDREDLARTSDPSATPELATAPGG